MEDTVQDACSEMIIADQGVSRVELNHHRRGSSVFSSDCDSSEEVDVDLDDELEAEKINQPSSQNTISREETRDVRRYKVIVYAVLLISAILFAVFVNVFIRNNETADFETAFNENAIKVFKAIGSSIDRTLIPLDTLSVSIVSYAKAVNATWPFVTLPDYALRMSKVLPQTDGMIIQSIHLVQPEERKDWELYTSQHNQWVNESISFQDNWDRYYGYISYDWEGHDVIHGDYDDIPQNVSRPLAPQWQIFPVSTQYSYPYNWDWLSQAYPEAIYTVIEEKKCIINYPYLIASPNDPVAEAENKGWIDYYSDFIRPDEEPYEPLLEITYPIIDDLDTESVQDGKVVGLLSIGAYFREVIRDVLPPGSNGMVIVVENACAENFTYQIDGPNVTYLGIHDQHEQKYEHLVVSSLLTNLSNADTEDSVYAGVPIDEEFCPYTLHLYPSKVMESMYTSNNATIFMFVTLLSFAVLAILFIIYDSRVERRQTKVLSSAVRSSELVSSLFPSSVQQRLYDANVTDEETSKRLFGNLLRKRKTATTESGTNVEVVEKEHAVVGNAIATLYPETTVMFADIRGFTAWSASRQPNEVFHLLESIYGAFDNLAKSFGVFKVETIGDTYVAVSGLPIPRKNHAIVMTRFAKACIEKMADVCQRLVATLGPDTQDLVIRVGLNSGPTTAGVLRGDKARFQLFGDTVNTASRMESTGECNKIHVTESTARALQQLGKGYWLTVRDDQVIVKGKGAMTTYWCDPSVQSRSKNGSSMNGSSHHHHEVGSTIGTFTVTSSSSSPPSTTSDVPQVHNDLNETIVIGNHNGV